MAWNEPGGNDKDGKDPWGNRGSSERPPDLEELWKKLRQQWDQLLGQKSTLPKRPRIPLRFMVGFILFAFLAAGYYSVGEGSQAVILRFGRYSHTVGSGPHWRIPFVDQKIVVDVEQVRSYKREGTMLTSDENIVDIELDIQYKIGDIYTYVLAARDPDLLIQQASESALRQVIGGSELDAIRTQGRETVAAQTKVQLQSLLDHYRVGLTVTQVNLQKAEPPDAVKAAFDDVIRAREDRERFINEAEAYANQILPLAEGEAKRISAEAQGYREGIMAEAEGKSQRFKKLLSEYEKSPDVTRERLYLETLENVLGKTSKILVDGQNNGPLFYMPFEKLKRTNTAETRELMEKTEGGVSSPPALTQNHETAASPDLDLREKSRQRERGAL